MKLRIIAALCLVGCTFVAMAKQARDYQAVCMKITSTDPPQEHDVYVFWGLLGPRFLHEIDNAIIESREIREQEQPRQGG